MKKQYKGTDRFIKCQGFQFTIGETYSIPPEQELKICEVGFHTCDTLLEVTKHYSIEDSRYFEVAASLEIEGKIIDDPYYHNKNCSRTIQFVRELTFNEVMRLLNFKEDGSLLSLEDDQTNLGFLNQGNYNQGNYNHGNNNRGNNNYGNNNQGNNNYGNNNYGNHNSGNHNRGNHNSGNSNSGNSNFGNNNQGNNNSGNHNTSV